MAGITGQTITQLTLSVVEKDVENSYRQYISKKIQNMIFTSPFQCDGFGVSDKDNIRLLCFNCFYLLAFVVYPDLQDLHKVNILKRSY